MMMMFALIFGVFYFLVIMPAKKQQKQKDAMVAALKKGDKIVTSGGIYGTVAAVEDQSVLLKIAENTKIRISKSAIGGPVGSEDVSS
ncbi:MAG: preprotein translocase subunit YajC [Acidobacteriota bacterium]|jgi:preprotein translocase subunit YajC